MAGRPLRSDWPDPGARGVPGVAAKRMMYFEKGVPELVMNCLAPLITQPPSTRRAVVAMLPASEPPVGSVRPKDTNVVPAAMPASSSWRCSAEARCSNRQAEMACTCTVTATPESTRASSSMVRQKLRMSPAMSPVERPVRRP